MEIEDQQRSAAALAKLELVKEIRTKTLNMLKMKEDLIEAIETSKREENSLKEFRAEITSLTQEKMSHVEELRQIHSDINQMEAVIKESEKAKLKSIEMAKKLHMEYLPIKNEVDRLRQSCLGLERLPELHEEDPQLITPEIFEPQTWAPPQIQSQRKVEELHPFQQSQALNVAAFHNILQAAQVQQQQQQQQQQRNEQQHHQQNNQQQRNEPQKQNNKSSNSSAERTVERPPPERSNLIQHPPPTFRQTNIPPPMKSCLSCHQQIHRNAPICPLCKAKSRSRNPKKPKKKDLQLQQQQQQQQQQ